MVAISKIGKCIKPIGKLVYSTGGVKPTFFDALKNSYSKPHIAKDLSRCALTKASSVDKTYTKYFKKDFDKYGVFSSRLKNDSKVTNKITNIVDDLTIDQASEMISSGKFHNLVGDGYGARIIVDDLNNMDDLVNNLIKLHTKKGSRIKIACIENYNGKGIEPYLNENHLKKLGELRYRDGKVIKKTTIADRSPKKGGYTRTNIDMYINGVRTELQIGGKYTTKFGEVEHYLYDMRRAGEADLSKLSPEQRDLFHKMSAQYQNVMGSKSQNKKFNSYTTEVWKLLKTAEKDGAPMPVLPDPPEGIPKILSVSNLFKLEHI